MLCIGKGNPEHEQSLYSRGRSLPFDEWLALQNTRRLEFVSIQKGQASEQLKTDQGLNFVSGQKTVSKSMDFCDTAAVIANCDLVITSDSSVAHLAGAMGVPTWLALRWVPEWRWGLQGTVHRVVFEHATVPTTIRWRLVWCCGSHATGAVKHADQNAKLTLMLKTKFQSYVASSMHAVFQHPPALRK